jgi:hypothetical protein
MQDYSLKRSSEENGPLKIILRAMRDLSEADAIVVRNELDAILHIEISQLNLPDEIGLQYRQGKMLLSSLQDDKLTPAGQRAQVFNSVSAQLEKIIKLRSEVYSQERLKRFEAAMLSTLKLLPDNEAKEHFFTIYSEILQGKGV